MLANLLLFTTTKMNSEDLLKALKNITDRLQALEAHAGQKTVTEGWMSRDTEPHEEATWDSIMPSTLTITCDTTLCAMPLLCGVHPPWAK